MACRPNADARLPRAARPGGRAPESRQALRARADRDDLLVCRFPRGACCFPYTTAQFKRDWDTLLKLSDEVASASSYPLTEDRQKCLFCTYRSYCERGIQAGSAEQAEAERETEELFDVNFEQIGEIAF